MAGKPCWQAWSHSLDCCKYRDSHKEGVNSNSRKDPPPPPPPRLGETSEGMNPWCIAVNLGCAQRTSPRCLLARNRPQKTEGTCNAESTMATQGRELRVAGRLPEPPEPLFPHTNGNEGLKELPRQRNKYRSGEGPEPVLAGQMWLARGLEGKQVRGQERSGQRTSSSLFKVKSASSRKPCSHLSQLLSRLLFTRPLNIHQLVPDSG